MQKRLAFEEKYLMNWFDVSKCALRFFLLNKPDFAF